MLTIREARPDDADQIRAVVEAHVDDYAMDVAELIAASETTVAVATDESEVVGVSALQRHPDAASIVDALHGSDPPTAADIACDGDEFGLLTTGYVRPARLREGIGRTLLAACLQHARAVGLDAVYAEADAYDENKDGRSLLERQGFERVYESADYWEIEDCTICKGECDCGGVIYRLSL